MCLYVCMCYYVYMYGLCMCTYITCSNVYILVCIYTYITLYVLCYAYISIHIRVHTDTRMYIVHLYTYIILLFYFIILHYTILYTIYYRECEYKSKNNRYLQKSSKKAI